MLKDKFGIKPSLEAPIQKSVIEYAHKHGVRTIRLFFGPGMRVGWPDVLFLIPGGRPLFIEFKATGGKPTMIQRKKIKLLKQAGYDVQVCDNRADGKRFIIDALMAAGELKD